MSVVHQIVPWMVRSRARTDHQRAAPPPSLKGAGRLDQKLRRRRSTAPALLYRSSDSPSNRRSSRERRVISSER
eukprot:4636654-Pyramimonas_sp.AAC.1